MSIGVAIGVYIGNTKQAGAGLAPPATSEQSLLLLMRWSA